MWDRLWIDAHLATMSPDVAGPYGAVRDGAVAAKDGRIAWVGAAADLPGEPDTLAHEVISVDGAWITPGLVDCHTHLVYAGDRVAEFEARLEGASYEDIARAGGGILSTVKATRNASLDALVAASAPRLDAMRAEGVTTVEIKSGYGLDLENELKMLEAAGRLASSRPVRVVRTLLGAHALPPEFSGDRAGYLDLVCNQMIPEAHARGLCDAVDAFCETIGFTADEVTRVFAAARAAGLPVKLHAEQLSDQGGAALAAGVGALSVDHLEHLSDDGVAAMAAAGCVAVLLPGAFYFLRDTQTPPIDALRAAGVPMAVATDCNPGSSPLVSPLLAMNMAATLFRLTPAEALAGMTRNAAAALGLADDIGTLDVGKAADFAVWRIQAPAELVAMIGANPCAGVVFAGAPIVSAIACE